MILQFSKHFVRSHAKAPKAIREAFAKQSQFLLQNLQHPSLHAKKYDETRDLWQARVTKDWRFYFKIVDDTYRLEDIKKHPKKKDDARVALRTVIQQQAIDENQCRRMIKKNTMAKPTTKKKAMTLEDFAGAVHKDYLAISKDMATKKIFARSERKWRRRLISGRCSVTSRLWIRTSASCGKM
jgi:mRNA interferase RelE/StbE